MGCDKLDVHTFNIVNDDYECIINVTYGDVNRAMEIVEHESEMMAMPRHKLNHMQRSYYFYNDHIDVFYDALKKENIRANIWEVS